MGTDRVCLFFNECGCYIIEEKRGENWQEQYCFSDYEKCDYYKYRRTPKCREDHEKALARVGASPAEVLRWP